MKIAGPKRAEVTGRENYIIRNFSLHQYFKVIYSRRMRCSGYTESTGKLRNSYGILVAKPERKKPLMRPRNNKGHNIKKDLNETGYEIVG